MNSRTPNNNFLEEEVEYEEVPEDQITAADEILEEVEGDIEAEAKVASQTMKALSEAEKRIEQANLYKAILNTSLFGPGSARPEIIKIVDKEFKEFVMYRMEVLLGLKADGQRTGAAAAAPAQFSANEAAALKDIARKLIAKQGPQQQQPQAAPTPTIQQVTGNGQPSINQVQDNQYQEPEAQPQVATKMVKRVVSRKVGGQTQPLQPTGKKTRRQQSANVSVVTGEDLSQAINPARPPLKMPSQAHMNALNAEQAHKNASAKASESGALAQALNTLLR